MSSFRERGISRNSRTVPIWQENAHSISSPHPVTISVLPPPISITPQKHSSFTARDAPKKLSLASSSPERIIGGTPAACSTASRKSCPLAASRAALVANTLRSSAPLFLASDAMRCTASAVFRMLSWFSIFRLSSPAKSRVPSRSRYRRSKTPSLFRAIRARTELDPIPITAAGICSPPSVRHFVHENPLFFL